MKLIWFSGQCNIRQSGKMPSMNICQQQLCELETKARQLRESFTGDRPLFVEFAGTPKSGKSTCIDTVNHFFRRLEFKVLAPTEGASKRTPYYLKQDLVAFNTWSATYALTHILEGAHGSDDYQLVIMDRGLFDALAWFELLATRTEITVEQCRTIQEFFLLDHWRALIDVVFLFETDPSTSLQRENRDKLIEEPGMTMNAGFLEELNEAYQTVRTKFSAQFNKFHVVNTSANCCTTPQSTAFAVAHHIVDHMSTETGPSL